MKIAEIETPACDGWREWLVIYFRAPDYISFAHEYTTPDETDRKSWQATDQKEGK